MGLFSGVRDVFTGSDSARAVREATDANVGQLRTARESFDPFTTAGLEALPDVVSGSTAEGFATNIGDILDGDIFDRLIGERTRSSEAALSQAGLRRSGTAARRAAEIPTQLAFDIEGELNRRRSRVANQGFASVGQQASISQLIGQVLSGGIIGEQNARNAGTQNLLDFGGQIFSAFAGGGGG